eukprot:gene3595-4477_t
MSLVLSQQTPKHFVSSNYTNKKITLLGTTLTITTGAVYFDEPLYLLESKACFDYSCKPYNFSCPPCDFRFGNPLGCGKSDSACTQAKCDSERYYSIMGATRVLDICNPNTLPNSQDIGLNQKTRGYIEGVASQNLHANYRFYAPPGECQGYKISLKNIEGKGTLFVSYKPYHPLFSAPARMVGSKEVDMTISMCPGTPIREDLSMDGSGIEGDPFGMIFVTVVNEDIQQVIFDIMIEPISVTAPAVPSSPASPKCTIETPGIDCIDDGEFKYIQQAQKIAYLSFTIDQCKNVTIQSITVGEDVDIYVNEDDPNVSKENFRWSSSYSFDDQIVIQVCPDPGKSKKVLYIGVDPFHPPTDMFIFVTTKASYTLRDITDNPVQAGSWALSGTTYLSNSDKIIRCENYDLGCKDFFPTYPRLLANPLYPVPGLYFEQGHNILKFYNIAMNETNNEPLKNVYQFGLVQSLVFDGMTFIYHKPEDVSSLKVTFLNRIVTRDGQVVTGTVPIGNRYTPDCDYDRLLGVDQLQNEQLNRIDNASLAEVNGIRYYFDVLTFEDNYYGCNVMAENFLTFNSTTSVEESTQCGVSSNVTLYQTDPCCSSFGSFSKCCRKRPVEVTRIGFEGLKESDIKDQCSFPDCANSVLRNYANQIVSSQSDYCSIQSEEEAYLDKLYTVFRSCHNVLKSFDCTEDSHCSKYGADIKCGILTSKCQFPYQQLEKLYLKCIVEESPLPLLTEVLVLNDITPSIGKSQLIDRLYDIFSIDDCVTEYNVYDTYRRILSFSTDYDRQAYCFPYLEGLDRSLALKQFDICYQGSFIFKWITKLYDRDQCLTFAKCDWLGSEGTQDSKDIEQLKIACADNTPTHYCGDCSDSIKNCYSRPAANESECVKNYVCYNPKTPLGQLTSYETDVTDPADCGGDCSVSCGFQCSGSACLFGKSKPDCEAEGGYPVEINGVSLCLSAYSYVTNKDTCLSNAANRYQDCGQFTADTCTYCNDTESLCGNFGTTCFLQETPCETKAECEAAGVCSDRFYFKTPLGNYPTWQPKCVFPRDKIPIYASSQPTCTITKEQDSPMGCYSFELEFFNNKSHCEIAGGKWWTPAKSEQECTEFKSCYGFDTSQGYIPRLTHRFNPKTKDDCDCADQIWKNGFEWEKGVWIPKVAKRLQWIPVNMTQPLNYYTSFTKALHYERLFASFNSASIRRSMLLYKSEMLCRMSNSKSSIKALSCSCRSGNGSSCFDDLEAPKLSIIKPCSSPPTVSRVNSANINFYDHFIDENHCISISMGELSTDTFLAKQIQALSTTFVSVDPPGDYSLYNKDKAVIGKILANAITFEFFDIGVKQMELCLNPYISPDFKKFPHYDVALLVNDIDGIVEPLQCNIQQNFNGQRCCNITRDLTGTKTFLLMSRIDDWDTLTYQPFSHSNKSLIYVLAVFFLVLSIFGVFHLFYFLYTKFFYNDPFKLVHLLFLFLTCFSLIRSIYFFILPAGVFSQGANVADYVLVVLPTFLYFTSFTVVVVIWYVLSNAETTFGQNLFKRINMTILGINLVLYILFIVIVLVFNFTTEKPPPTCGGRIVGKYSNTSPQKVVSILYAVLQAVLSLLIGLAFIYYGRKVYLKLASLKGQSSENSRRQKKKTLAMAIICSSGFVLHCIFIIILASAAPSNIIFSFIGLLVTEIIPVLTLFITYNQIPIMKRSKQSIKKLVNLSKGGGSGSGGSGDKNNSSTTSLHAATSSQSQSVSSK